MSEQESKLPEGLHVCVGCGAFIDGTDLRHAAPCAFAAAALTDVAAAGLLGVSAADREVMAGIASSSTLEALALILRGASQGGAPLVTEGAWADLTGVQRVRWKLFAARAFIAVEMIQREHR